MRECKAYHKERAELETIIINEIGIDEWELLKIKDDQCMKTILGLENSKTNIINGMKVFLTKVWKIRSNETRNTNEECNDHTYAKVIV